MGWFSGGGRRVSGKDCDDDVEDKKNKEKKQCDGCFPSKAGSPIVVKITRPRNNVNRMGYGSRLPSNRGDCCNWCKNKENVNQMVYNQNKIINFDLINRINDVNSNAVAPNQPNQNLEKQKCGNCIRILREKELELLKKEQEILKIKTHFTTRAKTSPQDGLGTNCEHCFKALREKEYELFRKEQEIAKMKMAAITNPIDTQAKVDRAKCANCFKALRQKELELLKKEHALMKNMTRPNINVKNLNYCSCCRDNNKSSINALKKAEDIRKKKRDQCFKALRMKEIQLLQKEREIDKKIQKFREESIAKARQDLEKVPDPRLVAPKDREVIKCVCSCSGLNNQNKERDKAKGICKVIYAKLPPVLGGTRGTTAPPVPDGQAQPIVKISKSGQKKISFKDTKRTCKTPCCALKLVNNFTSYLIRPPGPKQPKQKLPPSCSFMKLVTWCGPGHLQQTNVIQKCCTMFMSPAAKKAREKEDKLIVIQQAKAIKAAKAASEAISKTDLEYRVKTVGRIRPGKSRTKSTANLDVVEAEVLKTYGPKGLESYKLKMAELDPQSVLRSSSKRRKTGMTTGFGPDFQNISETKGLTRKEYQTKIAKTSMPGEYKSQVERYKIKGSEKYRSKRPQHQKFSESPREYGDAAPRKLKSKFQTSGFQGEDIEPGFTKSSKSGTSKMARLKGSDGTTRISPQQVGDGFSRDDYTRSTSQKMRTKMPSFKTKVERDREEVVRESKGISKFKTKFDSGETRPRKYKTTKAFGETDLSSKYKSEVSYKSAGGQRDGSRVSEKSRSGVSRASKRRKIDYSETEAPRKHRTKVDYDEGGSEVRKKLRAKADDDKYEVQKKEERKKVSNKAKKYEDDYEPPKRKRSKDYEDEPTVTRRPKVYDDDDYEEPRSRRSYKRKAYDLDVDDELIMEANKRETRYRSQHSRYPQPPPCPMFVKVLGRSLIYCAGCFIGVPCIIFLCLCLLCSTCSD